MLPLGIRQNNPGNIRATPNSFRSYGSPEEGLAATMQNLIAYNDKHGINTINGALNRWAPASDGNNIGAYVNDVAQTAGMHPDQPYDVRDPQTLMTLAGAITKHENGSVPYTPDQFNTAAQMALNNGSISRSSQSVVMPPQANAAAVAADPFAGVASDVQASGSDPFAGVASDVGAPAPQSQQVIPYKDAFIGDSGPRLQQVAKGATFGLSDEIGAGLGAGRMAIDRGSLNNLGEDYNVGLQGVRQEQAQFEKENPLTSMGLQIVGGLPAALASGTALANGLRGSSGAARVFTSGLAGAASGGAYGFGTGEGQEDRLKSARQGALAGSVLGAALPIAPAAASTAVTATGKGLQTGARGLMARSPEALQAATETMKKGAGATYNEMRDAGVVFNPDKINRIVGSIDQAVSNPQFIAELNPKTLAIVNHIKSAADTGALSLSDLDQYRRLLLRVGNSEDGVSAGSVKKAIDSEVTASTGADLLNGDVKGVGLLNKGRADYAKASRFEEVSDILAKANGDPNRIKAGLSRFVANDDNLNGFSPAERMALRKAADTGIGENILKAFGKFGLDFSKSGVGNTVLPALSALAGYNGVPGGIPLAIGGTIARQGQKYIARGKAENALRVIEGRP